MDASANAKLSNAMTDVVMSQVMRDKLADYEKQQKQESKGHQKVQRQEDPDKRDKRDSDDDDMDEDEREIFEKMKRDRLREMQNQPAKVDEEEDKSKTKNLWYGEYTEIVEQEFLPYVTKAEYSVCHFYHKDFERCKIIDKHLQIIAPQHKECKFLKLDAEKSPFFVNKLVVQVLPTLCLFKNGVLVDKVVGFEDFGGKDDFNTVILTRRLIGGGVCRALTQAEKGIKISKGGRNNDDSDSDGDF